MKTTLRAALIELFRTMKMSYIYSTKLSQHSPHVATEHLTCGSRNE